MRRTPMAVLLLVATAAASAPAAAGDLGPARPARLDAWRVIGPGGGGTMRRPAISPHDPKVVVLGCDMTGAYITADGGASWRMFNLGSVPTAFAFDPSRPQTIYAGAEAVYRSDDSGRTWRMVLPDPAKNTVGAVDRGPRRPRDLHRRPRLSRQRPQRHDPRDRGGRGRPRPRLRRGERGGLAGPGHARLADAPPRLDGRGTHVVAGHGVRLGADLRAARREPRRGPGGARDRGDRRVPGSVRRLAALSGARRRALHVRDAWSRSPIGSRLRLRHAAAVAGRPRGRGAGGIAGGVQMSEDGGRTWHAANGSLLDAVSEVGRGEAWGPSRGLAAVPRAGRGLVPLPRSWPTRACAASSFPAAATHPSTASRRRPTAGVPGASSTRNRTSPRRTSPHPGSSRARRRTATRSGSTRLTTSRSRRTIPTSPTRPTSSGRIAPWTAAARGRR